MNMHSLLQTYIRCALLENDGDTSSIFEASKKVEKSFDVSSKGGKFSAANVELPSSFTNTKMVSPDGRPIVFYHGTRKEFKDFNREFSNTAGTAVPTNYLGFFFTTSPDVARIYISKKFDPSGEIRPGGHVRSFMLDVQRPYHITEKTYWKLNRGSPIEIENFIDKLKSNGYDAIVMPAVWRGRGQGAFDVVVFDSRQISEID